ncbi:MAG: hypothetical protein K5756_04800 [Clostridiales bacterium]|nr:hypothetical protein [Clostridiales bacterium]
MKNVEISLNSDGSFSCSQDNIYVGEHMAVELAITLPEEMQTGFDSYALRLDPAGMCKVIVVKGIDELSENDEANTYISQGVIHCTLPGEFTGTPELFMQAEARREADNHVTYIEKTAVFSVKFEKSLVGREFVTDPDFSEVFDPERYTANSFGHTHSYNSLLDLPELYQPDENVYIKFVSTVDENYNVPAQITNPRTRLRLPNEYYITGQNKVRRMYGWKLNETDEHIFEGGSFYTLPEGFKGTLTFFAHWTANYREYIDLVDSINNMVTRDAFPANSNDPSCEGIFYRLTTYDENEMNELTAELALANERVYNMDSGDQFEVDSYVRRLRDKLNAIKLKKLPVYIDCDEGSEHAHDWKQIVNYCFSLFGEDVNATNISVNTPIPEDCKFTVQSMEALRSRLASLSGVLAQAMADRYRICHFELMEATMSLVYEKYHGLTLKETQVIDLTSTTVSLSPEDGVEYKYGTLNTLSISLPAEPRYRTRITFVSGSTATVVAFTSMPLWADGVIPEIEADRTYQIDIEDGLAVWRGFYAAT